jgi:hypothetical protein
MVKQNVWEMIASKAVAHCCLSIFHDLPTVPSIVANSIPKQGKVPVCLQTFACRHVLEIPTYQASFTSPFGDALLLEEQLPLVLSVSLVYHNGNHQAMFNFTMSSQIEKNYCFPPLVP